MRQGTARNDDGSGFGRTASRSAGARWSDAAAGSRRGRRQGTDHRRPLCAAADHAGIRGRSRMPHMRIAGRRLPVFGHGRDRTSCWRGTGIVVAAYGSGAFRSAHLARCGKTFSTCNHSVARIETGCAQCVDGCGGTQRNGVACGLRRVNQFAVACPCHSVFGGLATANACGLGEG